MAQPRILPNLPESFGPIAPTVTSFNRRFDVLGTSVAPLQPFSPSTNLNTQRSLWKAWKVDVSHRIETAIGRAEGDFVRQAQDRGEDLVKSDIVLYLNVIWYVMMAEVARIVHALRSSPAEWTISQFLFMICQEDSTALESINANLGQDSLETFLKETATSVQGVAVSYFTRPAINAANETQELLGEFQPLFEAMRSCKSLSYLFQGRNPWAFWRVWICCCWLEIKRTRRFKGPRDEQLVDNLRKVITHQATELRNRWSSSHGGALSSYLDVLPKPEEVAEQVIKAWEDHKHLRLWSLSSSRQRASLTARKSLVYNDLD